MKDNLKDIGILGRRHYDYLKTNKPTVINVMRMNGTLNSYLKGVNEQAEEMLFGLKEYISLYEHASQMKTADVSDYRQLAAFGTSAFLYRKRTFL